MKENPALYPMNRSPRCGAKTRRGTACRCPAMKNGRCKLHGGKSTGPPLGSQNAWKHGLRSSEHRVCRLLLKEMRASLPDSL
jgi:hypothetical protein